MQKIRTIDRIIKSKPVIDGAGVKLNRFFGYYESKLFDPFLLLDFFGSDNPDDYIAGFPWHPHRGIETVTYMLEGMVEHGDSMGNSGVINSGDIQWMTAGSGIIHQEMPRKYEGTMRGFQLWVNLPAIHKMMNPRYQDIPAKDIPKITLENNIEIKVIAGEFNGKKGPVKDIIADPIYYDISIPPQKEFMLEVKPDYTVFAMIFEGEGFFDETLSNVIKSKEIVSLKNGNCVKFSTRSNHLRFIFVSGKPLNEPIAWGGPIVMNTQEELDTAFKEYREGNFIK